MIINSCLVPQILSNIILYLILKKIISDWTDMIGIQKTIVINAVANKPVNEEPFRRGDYP
jgi:hypothetical protein